MRIFGLEIIRARKAPISAQQKMIDGCDLINEAWKEMQVIGDTRLRPWVIWQEKRIVISEFHQQETKIFYEGR
jgi:hypothetical protein